MIAVKKIDYFVGLEKLKLSLWMTWRMNALDVGSIPTASTNIKIL